MQCNYQLNVPQLGEESAQNHLHWNEQEQQGESCQAARAQLVPQYHHDNHGLHRPNPQEVDEQGALWEEENTKIIELRFRDNPLKYEHY